MRKHLLFSWGIAAVGCFAAGYLALNVTTFVGTGPTTEARTTSNYTSSAADFARHDYCLCATLCNAFRFVTAGPDRATCFKTNGTAHFDRLGSTALHPGNFAADAGYYRRGRLNHVGSWSSGDTRPLSGQHARTDRPGRLGILPSVS